MSTLLLHSSPAIWLNRISQLAIVGLKLAVLLPLSPVLLLAWACALCQGETKQNATGASLADAPADFSSRLANPPIVGVL